MSGPAHDKARRPPVSAPADALHGSKLAKLLVLVNRELADVPRAERVR